MKSHITIRIRGLLYDQVLDVLSYIKHIGGNGYISTTCLICYANILQWEDIVCYLETEYSNYFI